MCPHILFIFVPFVHFCSSCPAACMRCCQATVVKLFFHWVVTWLPSIRALLFWYFGFFKYVKHQAVTENKLLCSAALDPSHVDIHMCTQLQLLAFRNIDLVVEPGPVFWVFIVKLCFSKVKDVLCFLKLS